MLLVSWKPFYILSLAGGPDKAVRSGEFCMDALQAWLSNLF